MRGILLAVRCTCCVHNLWKQLFPKGKQKKKKKKKKTTKCAPSCVECSNGKKKKKIKKKSK